MRSAGWDVEFGGDNVLPQWPTGGSIEVRDLVVRYTPDLPPVLNHLTFSISPGERVGVVGRTGAFGVMVDSVCTSLDAWVCCPVRCWEVDAELGPAPLCRAMQWLSQH